MTQDPKESKKKKTKQQRKEIEKARERRWWKKKRRQRKVSGAFHWISWESSERVCREYSVLLHFIAHCLYLSFFSRIPHSFLSRNFFPALIHRLATILTFLYCFLFPNSLELSGCISAAYIGYSGIQSREFLSSSIPPSHAFMFDLPQQFFLAPAKSVIRTRSAHCRREGVTTESGSYPLARRHLECTFFLR